MSGTHTSNNIRGSVVLQGLDVSLADSVKARITTNGLRTCEYNSSGGGFQLPHLHVSSLFGLSGLFGLNSLFGDVFTVLFVLNEVGPPGSNFGIIDPMVSELKAEICVHGEKTRIQPPENELEPFRVRWQWAHILGVLRS